jgi:trigger factor
LDETLDGMTTGGSTTFTSAMVAGDYAGREAEVSVTVRTVKERELPPLDDDFAQLASEFDTLDELRADLAQRLGRVRKMEQIVTARDKALEALVATADVPAPEGVLRDEVDRRKQAMDRPARADGRLAR